MNKDQKMLKFLFRNGSSFAYALISLLLAVFPEDFFKTDVTACLIKFFKSTIEDENLWIATVILNKVLLCLLVFFIVKLIYVIWKKFRRKVVMYGLNYSICIEYGDMLEIKKGKKVINFDECFTTTVGEKPWEIRKDSICGQYLQKYGPIDVNKLIENAKVKPAKTNSKFNNQTRYEPGTIVPNGEFLLLAFARLDKEGRGCLTYEEYLNCLNKLWNQIDIYRETKDVYIPILGSHITRFDVELNQQQILDIMIASYRLSRKRIRNPEKLHIVCRKQENFSINDVFGIE